MQDRANLDENRIIIFDTTLRDGEQSPGAAMTKEEKIRIALQLEKLGVDVIEAGFAASSPGEVEAIKEISNLVKKATICSLSRANEKDVRIAGEALLGAKSRRIHTFIATSPIHMEYKLRKTPDQVLKAAVNAVKIAKEYTTNIEFSAEDSTRSDMEFLIDVFSAVIEAGATTINVPDTVGYSIPSEWYQRFKTLIARVKNSDKVIWSTHCQDDLGLSVANSISAVQAGARQIECTINGIGERAGNASLEEIVMILETRKDLLGFKTNINTKQILTSSKLVSTITGYLVPPNKAIVGINAFSHESGIHQDGVLKNRETYEIMSAESVGWEENRLTLGKLSGRNAFKTKLEELGILLDTEEKLNAAFARFKNLADKKREIYDEDLHALVSDEINLDDLKFYKFITHKIYNETGENPNAEVVFTYKGKEYKGKSTGSGSVDAVFKAIESIVQSNSKLLLYSVNAITSGTESQAEVTVRLEKNNKISIGHGSDIDVIVASIKAYLSALNYL